MSEQEKESGLKKYFVCGQNNVINLLLVEKNILMVMLKNSNDLIFWCCVSYGR